MICKLDSIYFVAGQVSISFHDGSLQYIEIMQKNNYEILTILLFTGLLMILL